MRTELKKINIGHISIEIFTKIPKDWFIGGEEERKEISHKRKIGSIHRSPTDTTSNICLYGT